MERRNFLRLSVTAAAAAPAIGHAESSASGLPAGADLYYTKESAGRWAAKTATHLPLIEIEAREGANVTVKITTAHEMKAYEHYIVKHALLDKNLKFIDERLFDPAKDQLASSRFQLKNYSGKLYAVSMCNKHDVWVSEIII